MQLLSSSQREYPGFSLGAVDETSFNEENRNDDLNNKDTSHCAEPKEVELKNKNKTKETEGRKEKEQAGTELCQALAKLAYP